VTAELPVIFVVGASRSGTTMLSHVLGTNSLVYSCNELHFVGEKWRLSDRASWTRSQATNSAADLLATARRSIWRNLPTDEDRQDAAEIVSKIEADELGPQGVYVATLRYLMRRSGEELIVDQTPRNIYYAQQLLEIFPQAKIIQLVRDPRAVLYSQRNRWRQKWLGADHTPFLNALRVRVNYHPITTSRLWLDAYRIGQAIRGHPRVKQVGFEELVERPEPVLRELSGWLGIDFEGEMLHPPKVGSSDSRHDEKEFGFAADAADRWRSGLPDADTWICQWRTRQARGDLGYDSVRTGWPLIGVLLYMLLYPFHIVGVLLVNPCLATRIWKTKYRQSSGES